MKLKYNSIYYFRYKSKLADEKRISIYDRAPLVIWLDLSRMKKGKVLGINLHWVPKKYRKTFIQIVQDIFKNQKAEGKKIPRLFYQTVKYNITLKNIALFSIRLYFVNRMSNITEVPYEFWDQILSVKRFKSRFAKKSKNYKI